MGAGYPGVNNRGALPLCFDLSRRGCWSAVCVCRVTLHVVCVLLTKNCCRLLCCAVGGWHRHGVARSRAWNREDGGEVACRDLLGLEACPPHAQLLLIVVQLCGNHR